MSRSQKLAAADARRSSPTEAERILWNEIRDRKLDSFRIEREREILGWWADFYCPAARLVVEVDGRDHRERRAEDNRRDEVMKAEHYRVLRIPAWVVFNELPDAVERIHRAVDTPWARRRRERGLKAARKVGESRSASHTVENDEVPEDLLRQSPNPERRKFHCLGCDRAFVTDVNSTGWIECRSCLAHDLLRPVCFSCKKTVEKVTSRMWFCQRCSDIRDVANRAARAGDVHTGPVYKTSGRVDRRWH